MDLIKDRESTGERRICAVFFFDPQMRRAGDRVVLSQEESYHITKVLRLQPGVEIEVMDGAGEVFTASILELGLNVVVQLLTRLEKTDGDRVKLWVGQGFLKGKKNG